MGNVVNSAVNLVNSALLSDKAPKFISNQLGAISDEAIRKATSQSVAQGIVYAGTAGAGIGLLSSIDNYNEGLLNGIGSSVGGAATGTVFGAALGGTTMSIAKMISKAK